MKKIISMFLVVLISLSICPSVIFADEGLYKNYKEIIDSTINTYGAFEKNVNFYATGLIYGEFIDFDNDNIKEMMLIYKKKNVNSYDAPFANVVIYGMKDNAPVKLFEEGIYGSLGQTDMGYHVFIKDINGQKHLLINSKKAPVSYGDSENIIVFTMQNKKAITKEYYGEVLPWWDSYEFKYTKCMIDNNQVSEKEYAGSVNQYYTDSQRITLIIGNDFDNFVFCNKEKIDSFIAEAKSISKTEITGMLYEQIYKDRFGNSEPYLILRTDTPSSSVLTDSAGKSFEIAPGDELQISIKGYSPEMVGARVKIKSFESVFEAHSSYHVRPIVILNADVEILRKPINVLLDGEKIMFDQQPIIVAGRTLVPLRAIFEKLGATVEWDENTKTVTAADERITVSLSIGKTEMYKNGELITLDVVPQLIGGRTLVPVRAVAEGFGCKVEWNEETRTILITADKYKKPTVFALQLCSAIEDKLGGDEYFNQAIQHNELIYNTLCEIDDSIDFKETVLTLEGGALEICDVVLKYATGRLGEATKEIAGALVSNGTDVMFAALKASVPDMQSFIYNLGVTACEKQENDIENLKMLHSKIKSNIYSNEDVVAYIYLYYQMMINTENSKLSINLLSNVLPKGFFESLDESLKVAVGVFMPSISGDILDLDLPTEVMMSILEEYASFACGEANDFYSEMMTNINDPAIEEWSENVQKYTNELNEKLLSIK